MNRKEFLNRLTVSSGMILGFPGLLFGKELQDDKQWSGYKPNILTTPWNQKVFFDNYTYMDMLKGKWRMEGLSYEEIEPKIVETQRKIDNNELILRRGPSKLLQGLWLIDVDGQQNTYLLKYSDGLILVDPGMSNTTEIVIRQIEQLGFLKEDVTHILLTHCHFDHAQSAAFWESMGAEILIHEYGVNPIQTGNEITAWWLGKETADRSFPKVKKARSIHDGDMLSFGALRIFACHTPGHTPDSTCFILNLQGMIVLISGDVAFHYGKHGWMGHPYSDYENYLKSLWKLKNFALEGRVHNEKDRMMVRDAAQYDMLLPGHTAICMSDASLDIDRCIEVMSYTIQQRRTGIDYQWTEPYTFFAEREISNAEPIKLEYR